MEMPGSPQPDREVCMKKSAKTVLSMLAVFAFGMSLLAGAAPWRETADVNRGDREAFEQVRPVLECMGQPVYTGGSASGSVTKLVNNMIGGAMLAAVGCGEYASVEDAAAAIVRVVDTVEPEPELVAKYEERYQTFRRIYPALKGIFPEV